MPPQVKLLVQTHDDSDSSSGMLEDWVQCEKCHKHRKLPPGLIQDDLPDNWRCELNQWDRSMASCAFPQEEMEEIIDNAHISPSSTSASNDTAPRTDPSGFRAYEVDNDNVKFTTYDLDEMQELFSKVLEAVDANEEKEDLVTLIQGLPRLVSRIVPRVSKHTSPPLRRKPSTAMKSTTQPREKSTRTRKRSARASTSSTAQPSAATMKSSQPDQQSTGKRKHSAIASKTSSTAQPEKQSTGKRRHSATASKSSTIQPSAAMKSALPEKQSTQKLKHAAIIRPSNSSTAQAAAASSSTRSSRGRSGGPVTLVSLPYKYGKLEWDSIARRWK
jgi:hypothetical protein